MTLAFRKDQYVIVVDDAFADHCAATRCDQQSSRARDNPEFFATAASHMGCKADNVGFQPRRISMKTIASALIALSLVAAIAAPANAADGYNTNGGRDVGQSSPL
jgi:hypothetical protein